jgi:hypothetical protein
MNARLTQADCARKNVWRRRPGMRQSLRGTVIGQSAPAQKIVVDIAIHSDARQALLVSSTTVSVTSIVRTTAVVRRLRLPKPAHAGFDLYQLHVQGEK